MAGERKKVPARFYRSASGAEPVREWLLELDKTDRKEIGKDIATVEYGWPVGMPACAPLGAGLYEVRTNLGGNRIARVLFCFASGNLVLLHGFIKKARKTPHPDLELARWRQREVER
jgi:phage-related protein